MTNPINKKTKQEFINQIDSSLGIEIIGEYINTDTKIKYRCIHGINEGRPWQILKLKHCCRTGYYESGKMWEKRTNTLQQLRDRALKDRKNIDVTETYIDDTGKYKKLMNIRCTLHDRYYDTIARNKTGQCPDCYFEDNLERLKLAQKAAWKSRKPGPFVSHKEKKWLDELGVNERQYWLEDVRYKVDGYDPDTKTVYLYHGKFWHGCPKSYDPEMIHPVIKLPMKDLYEKTMMYEEKIKTAGYNLVTKWEE